jgi:hypothetical protein
MGLKTENLGEIETATIDHYNQNAEAFWNKNKDQDSANPNMNNFG